MKKNTVLFALVGVVLGMAFAYWRAPKGDPLDKLFPPPALKGAQAGAQVSIFTHAGNKNGVGHGGWVAQAVLPFGMTPEQFVPTAFALLKDLIRQQKGATDIRIFIAEDSLLARAYEWMGYAIYRNGKVTVFGGLPSQGQVDSAAAAGNPLVRPDLQDRRFIASVYDSTSGLAAERLEITLGLQGETSRGAVNSREMELPLETAVLGNLGKLYGYNAHTARDRVLAIHRYYWLNAHRVVASI